MAYALSGGGVRRVAMRPVLPVLPVEADTVAELRALYRAAEARAARLRLLSGIGQELTLATAETLDERLQRCARSVAFFLGQGQGAIVRERPETGIAIPSPGSDRETAAWLVVDGLADPAAVDDPEDRDTLAMCLNLFGATIDRLEREQERGMLLTALQEREQRLEALVGRIFSAQEDERRRVSQDLHDGVAQTATALVRMLEGAGASRQTDLAAADRARLAGVARALLRELRAIIGGLRPPLLDDLGLAAALQALGDGLAADGYAVAVTLEAAGLHLSAPVETALFRVAQEAVANIRKHAGAPCPVAISLATQPDGACVLRIVDRGSVAQPHTTTASSGGPGAQIGIEGMRERMAAIGATLDWGPIAGGGVAVTATLPGQVRA